MVKRLGMGKSMWSSPFFSTGLSVLEMGSFSGNKKIIILQNHWFQIFIIN